MQGDISMPFAALDLHKKVVESIVVDDNGTVLHRDRFPATRDALPAFANKRLSPDCALTLEATTNTWAVVELLVCVFRRSRSLFRDDADQQSGGCRSPSERSDVG